MSKLAEIRRDNLLAGIPESYQATFRKAYAKQSRSAAVKAKCLDCSGMQRKEVAACTMTHCPLWQYRPYQGKDNGE